VAVCSYVPPDPVFLSILKPDSLEELSVQEIFIPLVDAVVPVNPLGGTTNLSTAASKFTLGLVMVLFPSVMESPVSTSVDFTWLGVR